MKYVPKSYYDLERLEKKIEQYCLKYNVQTMEIKFNKIERIKRFVIFDRPDKFHKP